MAQFVQCVANPIVILAISLPQPGWNSLWLRGLMARKIIEQQRLLIYEKALFNSHGFYLSEGSVCPHLQCGLSGSIF